MNSRYFSAWLLMGFIGCSDLGPDNTGLVTLTTDGNAYQNAQTITFTLRNVSSSTVYAWHCNFRLAYRIESRQSVSWVTFGERNYLCLAIYLSGQQALQAGQQYSDTLSLSSPGLYRLSMPIAWDRSGSTGQAVYSNEFTVQ